MFTENLLFYKEESLIMAFIDTIKERAKADKKTIVLPESMERSRSMVRAMTFLAPQS